MSVYQMTECTHWWLAESDSLQGPQQGQAVIHAIDLALTLFIHKTDTWSFLLYSS